MSVRRTGHRSIAPSGAASEGKKNGYKSARSRRDGKNWGARQGDWRAKERAENNGSECHEEEKAIIKSAESVTAALTTATAITLCRQRWRHHMRFDIVAWSCELSGAARTSDTKIDGPRRRFRVFDTMFMHFVDDARWKRDGATRAVRIGR